MLKRDRLRMHEGCFQLCLCLIFECLFLCCRCQTLDGAYSEARDASDAQNYSRKQGGLTQAGMQRIVSTFQTASNMHFTSQVTLSVVIVSTVSLANAAVVGQVSTERGQAVADEFGSRFLETSAKDGTNVAEAFHQVAYDIFQARVAAGTGGGGGGPGHGAPAGGGPEKDKKCVVQ